MGGKKRSKFGIAHIFLLLCVFVLSAFYIFSANSIMEDRFNRENIDKKITELKAEIEKQEIKLSEETSLDHLKELSLSLALEEAKNISYIRAKSSSPLVLNQ